MMRTMTGRASRQVFFSTAWRLRLSFPSATTTVNTGFCKIRDDIVLSYVVGLSILPVSLSSVTRHCGRACLTVSSTGCGVRICVHFMLVTDCRLIRRPADAA